MAAIIAAHRRGAVASAPSREARGLRPRWSDQTRTERDDAVRTADPSDSDPAGNRARRELSPGGRAGPGPAHGARRPRARLLRAPRAAVEVPAAQDWAASAG